jgi:acyl dehydratase
MSTATLQFAEEGLGKWTEPTTFEVTRERLAEYAAATNDPIAAHQAGEMANPVFAIVPVFHSLLEPALEVVPLPVIGRVLHGEQDFRFHRPIRPGETLVARGKMTGFEGLPNGTRACVYLETRDEAGELVNEQYVTFFVRGFDDGRKLGELSPGHKFDEALRDGEPLVDG